MDVDGGRRGSDVLREAYRRGGVTLPDDIADGLADVTSDLILDDVLVRGLGAVDLLQATFRADDAERCGNVIIDILGLLGRKPGIPGVVKVFPKGVVAIDHFQVQVTLGAQTL